MYVCCKERRRKEQTEEGKGGRKGREERGREERGRKEGKKGWEGGKEGGKEGVSKSHCTSFFFIWFIVMID